MNQKKTGCKIDWQNDWVHKEKKTGQKMSFYFFVVIWKE